MKIEYINAHKKVFEEEFDKRNYKLFYPESHVIRWYERILKFEIGIDESSNIKFLDFGCGDGTQTQFFKSKGFDTYGVVR